MNFITKMFASGETDTISHKRFVSILAMVMLVALSLLSAFGHMAQIDFAYIFGVLTGGESMLTVIEKMTHKTFGSSNSTDSESEQ